METMSPQDASFLHTGDAVTHMHIGSVPAAVARQLPLVPRYRQKVSFVPLDLGRLIWVRDPHFTLGYHARRTALPSPAGGPELGPLAGRVRSQQLDRPKPLGEIWVAEGRWASLDQSRQPEPPAADPWPPQHAPSPDELVAHAPALRAASPYEGMRTALAALRGWDASQALEAVRGLSSLRRLAQAPPPSSLNGPTGPHRCWDWARGQLADVKEIRAAQGRTVNDVVLAAISGGFRELLIARSEAVGDRVVRTLVPVSVRAGHERETYINKISGMIADRPVSIGDPVARLNAIREQVQKLKRPGGCRDGRLVVLGGFTSAMLLRSPDAPAAGLPNVQTMTANVPVPRHSPYLCGRRMLEESPFLSLGSSVWVGVAIFSCDGTINFGVTGDRESAPDACALCRGIEHGMAALRSAASPTSTPKRPARATPKPAGREQRWRALRPRVAEMSSGEGQDAASVAESPAAYVYAGLRTNGDYYYPVTIPSLIVAAYGAGNGLATQRVVPGDARLLRGGQGQEVRGDWRGGGVVRRAPAGLGDRLRGVDAGARPVWARPAMTFDRRKPRLDNFEEARA